MAILPRIAASDGLCFSLSSYPCTSLSRSESKLWEAQGLKGLVVAYGEIGCCKQIKLHSLTVAKGALL